MRQRYLVGLAADAGVFVTAEGSMRRIQVITVGPHASGLDGASHAIGAIYVAGPQTGTQPELTVVGQCQGFGFVFEGGHADHRSEDLFTEETHAVIAGD
ncbi:hypothetical protein D3C72_2318020 [compost metagenome]